MRFTLIPEERFENVKRSVFQYVQQNYLEAALDYQGAETFNSSAVEEWVWVGISSKTHQYIRHIENLRHADLTRFTLHTVSYVKPTANIMRLDRMTDELRSLLRKAIITVYDHVGNGVEIGQAIGQGIQTDRPVAILVPGSAEGDIQTHVVDFLFQYLTQYS